MLSCLRVQNFAIIDELEVELGPGLNVVTGETGAGKSILVSALGLVLGARGRPEVVRSGARQAEVEALFEVGDDPALAVDLAAGGIEADGELIIRRVILASGRTRAYVNGRLTTGAQLAELAAGLADISSQHEHHRLVDPATHLDYLDAFAGLGALRKKVAGAHGTLTAASATLRELATKARDRFEREDLLSFQLQEIAEVSPEPGEEEQLSEERERLRHAERLATVAQGVEQALYANDGAVSEVLSQMAHELAEAGRIDPELAACGGEVDSARTALEDVAQRLGAYARRVSLDPERLAEVEERMDRLQRLKRKYGGNLEAVIAHREEAERELGEIAQHDTRVEDGERLYKEALEEARTQALALRQARTRAAMRLGKAISEELGSLGMGEARVEVEVEPLAGGTGELEVEGARLTARGIDRAEFLIAPNRGEVARPLRKVASGGELSRAMLAIKRVLSGLAPAGLYVFDEVDAGVGGAVAEVIGQKLSDVARHHQVLCITHLPQISVYGTTHFRVHKTVVGDRTRSEVRRLDEGERLEEVARMLGGLRVTEKTRAAAAELLRTARPSPRA